MRRLSAYLAFALGLLAPSLDAQARSPIHPSAAFQARSPIQTLRTPAASTRRSALQRRALARIQSRYSRRGLASRSGPPTRHVAFQPQVRGMGCLQPRTRAMIGQLTAKIGPITLTSTCGGRHVHNSQHYRGNAIDFRPQRASVGAALAALRSIPAVGGIGSYPGGLIHADVGTREAAWYGHGGSTKLAKRGFGARYAMLKLRKKRR